MVRTSQAQGRRPAGRTRCPPPRPSGTGLRGDCFSPLRLRPVFSSRQRVVTRPREKWLPSSCKSSTLQRTRRPVPACPVPACPGDSGPLTGHRGLPPGRLARRLRGSLALVQGRLGETLDALTAICIIIWLHVTHARGAQRGKHRPAPSQVAEPTVSAGGTRRGLYLQFTQGLACWVPGPEKAIVVPPTPAKGRGAPATLAPRAQRRPHTQVLFLVCWLPCRLLHSLS